MEKIGKKLHPNVCCELFKSKNFFPVVRSSFEYIKNTFLHYKLNTARYRLIRCVAQSAVVEPLIWQLMHQNRA